MEAAWIGDWHEWKLRSEPLRILELLPRAILIPFIFLACLFIPNSPLVRRFSLPINKMISHTASYIVFLILVFIESNLDKNSQVRGPPQSGLEVPLVIYVIGYAWGTARLCAIQGPRR